MRRLLLAAVVMAASASFGPAAHAWPCGNPKLDVVCQVPQKACDALGAVDRDLQCAVSGG
ncbi:MAG TPA: hypothetical protein VF519_07165 [Mycobacteriales bacterium]|jgi:hypothetical protein